MRTISFFTTNKSRTFAFPHKTVDLFNEKQLNSDNKAGNKKLTHKINTNMKMILQI